MKNIDNVSFTKILGILIGKCGIKKIFVLVLSAVLLASCASIKLIKDMPEEEGYSTIKKQYETRKYEEVANDVNEFRIRYPYSKYTAELSLMQANSFFNLRNFQTAAVTYEDFIRRHPTDPSVEFAQYRIAECYDFDSLKDDDRDQSNTQKAVEKYQEFLSKYPNSHEYKEKVEKRLGILKRRLAEHSFFIATFYWQKRLYAAALMRYLYIIDNYSQFSDIVKVARKNGAYCYNKLADMLQKNPKSDKYIFFKDETPQGLRDKAKMMAK